MPRDLPPLVFCFSFCYNKHVTKKSATTRTIAPLAIEYAARVRTQLGTHAHQVILFGSQARGDATPASDYDFVVVVDKRDRRLREVITNVGASFLNENDALCAALVYDDGQWQRLQQSPLGWNIEREGVVL